MKFLAVFAALVAVSAAAPTTSWTLNDLSQAIQSPSTPAAVLPYLENALNQMMNAIFAGQQVDSIAVPTPAGLLPVEAVSPVVVMPAEVAQAPTPNTDWTLRDLSDALENPATPADLRPYLEHALNIMMESIYTGYPRETIVVLTPAGRLPVDALFPAVVMPVEVDLVPTPTTAWTLNDLSDAIQNPATPAALLPYLEHALNEMMEALFSGHPMDSIVVPTPAGLLPVEAVSPVAVMPVEVDLSPVAPAPVPAPVVPTPVVPTPVPAPVADASSPLVQIIVNIKSQESAVIPEAVQQPQPVPAPVVVPEPVVIVEQPEAVYEPQPLPAPAPIEIGPAPAPVVVPEPIVIAPEPVVVAPEVPAPIVIAPAPIEIPNPIDVIAVGAPDFNPIDLLHPVPVNA